MRRTGFLLALAITLVLLASPAAATSQSTNGFVVYKVTVGTPTGGRSVVVNESVGSSSRAGFVDLLLRVTGSTQNLTYSRLVNASTVLFPFLPPLPAQSLDYSNGTRYSVHVNFSSAGTSNVTFDGSQYTLEVFAISVHGTYGNRSLAVAGTMRTFPSSLVYSASVVGPGGVEVDAVLLATDLALTQASSQTSAAAYVGASVGVGGVALAAALFVRRRERKVKTSEQKPLHWVD